MGGGECMGVGGRMVGGRACVRGGECMGGACAWEEENVWEEGGVHG